VCDVGFMLEMILSFPSSLSLDVEACPRKGFAGSAFEFRRAYWVASGLHTVR
jgi:hypothetical protein